MADPQGELRARLAALEEDVASIRALVADYRAFDDALPLDEQDRLWARIHARLRRDARKWWD